MNHCQLGRKGDVNHSQELSHIHLYLVLMHQCWETFTAFQRHFATSLHLRLARNILIHAGAYDSRKSYKRC